MKVFFFLVKINKGLHPRLVVTLVAPVRISNSLSFRFLISLKLKVNCDSHLNVAELPALTLGACHPAAPQHQTRSLSA